MLIEKEALAGSFHSKRLPNVTQKNVEERIHLVIGKFCDLVIEKSPSHPINKSQNDASRPARARPLLRRSVIAGRKRIRET